MQRRHGDPYGWVCGKYHTGSLDQFAEHPWARSAYRMLQMVQERQGPAASPVTTATLIARYISDRTGHSCNNKHAARWLHRQGLIHRTPYRPDLAFRDSDGSRCFRHGLLIWSWLDRGEVMTIPPKTLRRILERQCARLWEPDDISTELAIRTDRFEYFRERLELAETASKIAETQSVTPEVRQRLNRVLGKRRMFAREEARQLERLLPLDAVETAAQPPSEPPADDDPTYPWL